MTQNRHIRLYPQRAKTGKTISCLSAISLRFARPNYRVGVPKKENTHFYWMKPGGCMKEKVIPKDVYAAQKRDCDGKQYSIAYPLPGYGTAVFKF